MPNFNSTEASAVDIKIIDMLRASNCGWRVDDSLLYQSNYALTEEQKQLFGKVSIKPDIVLVDPLNSCNVMAVIENKLADEKKAYGQLRIDEAVLKPRFLYACSENRIMFYDTAWTGLDAGEYKRVNGFMSYEEMKIKLEQERHAKAQGEIEIDTTIAGGYDNDIDKVRYYQLDCIKTIIEKYKAGKQKMLIHMATGLGKTRTAVALVKALISNGLAKRVLFVVDRRTLAEQALNDGFSLISGDYKSAWIKTYNYKQNKHKDIHVVVIDTLELIFDAIPSNYYDLIIVDECHRSISVSRNVIFDHFVCPRLGLTATPKTAIKDGEGVTDEDVAIRDTYKLFGCENGKPDYEFDLAKGIDEGFLAPYDVLEIKTYLTQEAEEEGIPLDYVLDPDTRKRVDLPNEIRLRLEQLERKYISEERCHRIAEEIRKNTQRGEKVLLFGVSQIHCLLLAKAINDVFGDNGDNDGIGKRRYAEAIVSDNDDINEFLKISFNKPFEKPFVVTSVDIMSTGVDIKCIRYVAFAALTKSVGKYIQMVGRGSRLDIKASGKKSFRILDFVGLCKRMDDNGKGSPKPNETKVKAGRGSFSDGGKKPKGGYFIIDTQDPENMIERIFIHGDDFKVVDNIPIDEARKIFEQQAQNPSNSDVADITRKAAENPEYTPSDDEISLIEDWVKKPDIYLDEGQLQKIYDYHQGTIWDFVLHALKIKAIPTPMERVRNSFDSYINVSKYNDEQLKILNRVKEIIVSNIVSRQDINSSIIFGNPIYERLIGRKERVQEIFQGHFDDALFDMKSNLQMPSGNNGVFIQ